MCAPTKKANHRVAAACQQDKPISGADGQRRMQQAALAPVARRQQFTVQYNTWLQAHNQQHGAAGLWNDDLRLW